MGREGERDEHTREGNEPMIRYGSVHGTQDRSHTEASGLLLPRPRTGADDSSSSRPASA